MSLSITNISPSTLQDGDSVTLTGSGFGSSQGSVVIGGVAQSVSAWSDTSITFTAARSGQSMGNCRVDVVKGVSSTPTYTPLATWSATGGTSGNAITGWNARTGDLRYSNAITGPFGGSVTAREVINSGATSFGGAWIRDRNPVIASAGDTIWFRLYVYFASDFAFNYGTTPSDGSGHTKFIRFEDNRGDPGGRYTFQFAVSPIANGVRTATHIAGATDEVNSAPNLNDFFSPTPADAITRGAWQSVEVSMKVADATTNNGYIRAWINDAFVGEVSSVDNVTNGYSINDVIIGNYWNGSVPQSNTWYFDEFVLTKETPDATDSGGRAFIGSARRVADF